MFLHDTHLPQVLTPWHYTSQEQHDREVEKLFLPAWHFVATKQDLPNDGDFLTTELCGCPVVVWRTGGELHAFLNACPQRFARLADQASRGRDLRHNYHKWMVEGVRAGRSGSVSTCAPQDPARVGLSKCHLETCGHLVFVSLADDPPGLAEFLGPGYEVCRDLCGEHRHVAFALDCVLEGNWKVKVETSLESYHVEQVHPQTLGRMPSAEKTAHEVHERWTSLASWEDAASALDRFLDRLSHRIAGVEIDPVYRQLHYYPHIMFGKMRLFTWAEIFLPLTPHRSRSLAFVFCHKSRSGSWRGRLLTRALVRWGRGFFGKLAEEDARIVAEVQKGLRSPLHPSRGVVSAREERCFHFQKYIKRSTEDGNPKSEARNTKQIRMVQA